FGITLTVGRMGMDRAGLLYLGVCPNYPARGSWAPVAEGSLAVGTVSTLGLAESPVTQRPRSDFQSYVYP
ncbi:MAG TPA: hypothetical protein VMW79_07395, partial [Anaerolineae bacterium]|nr:hypothetical protein [Anaerolineae bacterium]